MTVSSTTTKNSYSGDGSTTTFAYAFKIFADADLTVILRSAAGTETVQTLTTNYSVTNAGNANGGNVVFVTAPASGVTVVIRRNIAQTQTTDYTANDPFPAESHEDALDRLTFIAQQQQEELDRSIKLSRTNTMTSTEFTVGATERANKILAFDSSGEISVTQELGTYQGTDATTTTEAYVVRDIVKSTTAGQLNNVYICVANSVVGDLLTDTDHFELLVDAVSAATSATNAANSASAASTSATNASNSASTATTQASNAATSATNAATSATNASNAQTAAETAQAAAEAALDTFDDRFLGAKSSDPSVDNDGNALIDGALYFDTTNDIMKVYDLTNTQWRQLTLTSANQTNVNNVAGQISPTNNIATVAGANSNITVVAGSIANVNTTASNISNVNSVAGNESNINSAVSNESNINAVVSNASNINSVAGNSTNINSVAGSITNVNTVATNLASVNNFGEVYRIASSAPTSSLNSGDLYFNTSTNVLNVYGASGWQNAGSSINGTSQRYHYDITSAVTSVTGADANGNTLAYDAGYVDVYVNGVRMSTADVTVTSGDTVTFASALANGDEVDIVGYGTFAVASLNADNLDSGTVPSARVSGAYTGITGTGALNAGSITSGFGTINTGSSNITSTGVGAFGSLDISGDIDVDGTTNLDNTDIDGNLDVTGASNSVVTLIKPQGALPDNNDNAGLYVLHQGTAGTGLRVRTDNALTGSNFAHVLVNNASASINAFQVSQYGSGLIAKFDKSGTTAMQIDNTGAITKPLQPAFQVNPASNQLNMGNGETIVFGQEKFDQNSDFSSNTFTAPVTGKYQLQLTARVDQLDRDANWVRIEMVTSNLTYEANIIDPDAFDKDPDQWSFNFSVLADMDANDTVFLRWGQSGGVAQSDFDTQAHFSGFLVC